MKLWIARDKDGTLCGYENMPIKSDFWKDWDANGRIYYLDSGLFPEITFENSPQQVELKLIEE